MNALLPTRPAGDPRDTSVWLRRELIASGANDRSIARDLRAGILERPRRGAYVDARDYALLDTAGRHGVLARAVLKNAETGAVLSHTSAVPEYDGSMWGFDLGTVHLTRDDGKAGRHEAGVQQHRGRIEDGDVVELNGVRVMSPTRCALEVTTVASAEPAMCLVSDFLKRGLTTRDQLRARYASMERWPSTLNTDVVLSLADPRLTTLGERRTWYALHRGGIPAPEPQFAVRDTWGEVVASLDFAWARRRLWLEFDGLVKYEEHLRPGERPGDAVVREKKREDMVRRLTGWRCLRIVWADLEKRGYVAGLVRDALSREE